MKKLLTTLLLAALSQSALAQDPLRISTDGAYPPFSETNEKGEMVGFDIDIGKALCEEMKRECTFTQTEWDGLIPALTNQKIDVILASMNANEERRKSIDFTDPYYINPGIFVRAKGSDIALTEEGLKGKVIGVLVGSVFDDYASEKFANWAEIKRYNTQEDVSADALAGRVDVLFADKVVLEDGFLAREEGKGFETFGDAVDDPKFFGEGISIGIRKEDQELKSALNAALNAIRENGKYKEINDKYFTYDISGGSAK
ncbi:MAG: transporter substrate-binding domain-containing protein [Cardiobacteriaceae bacterium]|nr:transporter substrate-binding domain-containing protein [Cardiobacteriaceae bacterium]